jgi:dTDP-4-dehydrorhamnose reductase
MPVIVDSSVPEPLETGGSSTLPTTAVFGANGFIGRNIYAGLRRTNPATIGLSRRRGAGLLHLDFTDPDVRQLGLKQRGVTHAVIAAAVSGVAACERQPEQSRCVNVEGTVELARQLTLQGIRVIAFSSDYVFDGACGNYDESSPVNPLNEYGRQKVEMEQRLLHEVGGDLLVIRLSKVFDTAQGSATLLDEMAGKLVQSVPVRAAYDQYFCPTYIDDVVAVTTRLMLTGLTGISHLCAPEKFSRLELARRVAGVFNCDKQLIREISLRQLGEHFARPLDTSMVCGRCAGVLPYDFRTIDDCLEDLREHYALGSS